VGFIDIDRSADHVAAGILTFDAFGNITASLSAKATRESIRTDLPFATTVDPNRSTVLVERSVFRDLAMVLDELLTGSKIVSLQG